MTDEYLPSTTDLNATASELEDTTQAVVTSKDEQIAPTVDENGYESECSSSSRSEEDVACSALEVEADAFTRFIERQRLEVMFELRRLRLGERPVTGQPNRERIETFLHNIQEHQQETRTPSTRPARPSAHIADIDALSNRRCVSAALSSVAFRQDLENTIRQSIGIPTVQQASNPIVAAQQRPPVVPTVPTVLTERSRPNIIQTVPASSIQQQRPQTIRTEPVVAVQEEPLREPLNVQRQARELDAWQAITQLQRERIVVEISDLVHRQLVTSALESDFRRHLEQNVLNRMEHGATVQQEQQTTTARPAPQPLPAHPPRVNLHVAGSNIDELSSRLDSMHQMLQVMFSMQMDMQRSIRQEVASALANNSTATTTTTATINPSQQPVAAGHCTICLTAIADTVLYRCGHLCVCYMCGLQLQHTASTNGIKCPVCRAPVDDILRVYRSSGDGE